VPSAVVKQPGHWLAPLSAGFVAVLVGFTSSVALVFEAARAAGATPAQIGSWLGSLCLGMGVCTIGLSLYYRKPVMVAWSTPGAALLATSLVGVSMPQAIGAFLFCAALITFAGVTGWFEKIMDRLPIALASAILAGVLTKFALDAVLSVKSNPLVIVTMFATYLLAKKFLPRYAIPLVLLLGVIVANFKGQLNWQVVQWSVTQPNWTVPEFHFGVLLSVGLPLFIVTMASQNLPGVATMRASGYDTPVSPVIATTGVVNLLLAPLGCYAINLAAITAAICMTPAAHPDKAKRYWAAVACGAIYLVVAVFGASIAVLLAAFPRELVFGVAGIALLGTIGNGLAIAMKEEGSREAALVTFLVTLSGISLAGVGSAFWAIVAGSVTYWIFRKPS
jgi:benzoate membrane transport protein